MNKENLLTKIKLSEDKTIKSIELVEIINEFRKLENGKAELKHSDFMKKIRKEVETLKTLGLSGQGNFSSAKYNDEQGKSRECYELTRDGMLQMLNSESTLVRYKTVEYINQLEEQVQQLESDNKELYKVAVSDKEKEKRQYEADRIKYAIKNIEKVLSECNYTNIVAEADKIIEVHRNLYVKDRYNCHKNIEKYGNKGDNLYINHIKNIIIKKFDKLRPVMTLKDVNISAIMSDKARKLQKEIEVSENISVGMESGKLKTENQQLKEELLNILPNESEYTIINYHGFSHNVMYRHEQGVGTVKTYGYNKWIQYFPRIEMPTKECYETEYNIDFTKPIAIYLKYICKNSYDIRNLDKSALDMIFNRILKVDDNIVEYVSSEKIGNCEDYKDGKITFAIRNI